MPVFTFEKISPPIHGVRSSSTAASSEPVSEKPRSVIVQFLDRFVEARVKRTIVSEKPGQSRKPAQ
jgi:predicted component of type VI protein secretion system